MKRLVDPALIGTFACHWNKYKNIPDLTSPLKNWFQNICIPIFWGWNPKLNKTDWETCFDDWTPVMYLIQWNGWHEQVFLQDIPNFKLNSGLCAFEPEKNHFSS